jgi:hypothetical protein
MIALRPDLKVVVAAHPVDFRKSVHTLSALVSEALTEFKQAARELETDETKAHF